MNIVFYMAIFSRKKSWVSYDAWRGHEQPVYAVVGASDSGMWSDSPAPSDISKSEINAVRSFLKKNGVHTQEVHSATSNVFTGKRWVIVPPEEYEKAKALAGKYLQEHEKDTRLLHEADVLLKEHKKRKLKDVS